MEFVRAVLEGEGTRLVWARVRRLGPAFSPRLLARSDMVFPLARMPCGNLWRALPP